MGAKRSFQWIFHIGHDLALLDNGVEGEVLGVI